MEASTPYVTENQSAHDVLWRRLRYSLTPQWDIYRSLREENRLAGKSVLEVGFGTGAGVLQYADLASWVDAIEPDPGAVDFASKMFPLGNVAWMLDDITQYHTHKHYDYVIMVETLEHVPDWRRALENIYSLLNPGGDLVMTARNANADLRRWKELHEREWTSEELVQALEGYFEDVWLYDYSLSVPQGYSTSMTPLVAIARKPYL